MIVATGHMDGLESCGTGSLDVVGKVVEKEGLVRSNAEEANRVKVHPLFGFAHPNFAGVHYRVEEVEGTCFAQLCSPKRSPFGNVVGEEGGAESGNAKCSESFNDVSSDRQGGHELPGRRPKEVGNSMVLSVEIVAEVVEGGFAAFESIPAAGRVWVPEFETHDGSQCREEVSIVGYRRRVG